MTLVALGELGPDAREQLAQRTLPAARAHGPEWLADLDAARAQIGVVPDAEGPGIPSICLARRL